MGKYYTIFWILMNFSYQTKTERLDLEIHEKLDALNFQISEDLKKLLQMSFDCWQAWIQYCRWKFSSAFFIHLLDLTRNSCEKCNFRSLVGIEPAALRFRCSALTNWATEASCRALTTSSCIYTRLSCVGYV